MKRIGTLVIMLIATVSAADPADDVRCREIAFSKSIENRDIEAFKSFIDPDARFVGSSISRGPEEIAAAWSVFVSQEGPRILWRPQIIEVLDDSTLALSRGPYRYTATDENGVETELWGTFNSIWRLQEDGSWKVVFDAGNAAAEPPVDEVRTLLDAPDDCED
jgi:ketosteroid isomerase-like protein